MLFRELFIASNPKWLLETLTCTVYEMIRYGWLSVSGLSCRPENPPFPLTILSPTGNEIEEEGMEMVIRQSDRIAYLSGRMGDGRSSDTQ